MKTNRPGINGRNLGQPKQLKRECIFGFRTSAKNRSSVSTNVKNPQEVCWVRLWLSMSGTRVGDWSREEDGIRKETWFVCDQQDGFVTLY